MSSVSVPCIPRAQLSSMGAVHIPPTVVQASRFHLSYFNCSLFGTALEDLLIQFRILLECNNELRIWRTTLDMKTHMAQKYGVEKADRDELEGVDEQTLHCNEYKLNKLDADRKFVEEIFLGTYKDMAVNNSFSYLAEGVRQIVDKYAYGEFLVEHEAKNRLTRREMNKQLRQLRNHVKTVVYDADNVIDGMKRKVEDAGLNCETESRYIESWQRARTEQLNQLVRDREDGPAESIEFYKQRADHEQRVHSEIEMIVNIITNETLEKVEHWMDKYDADMEAIDLKLQIMKNNFKNAEDHTRELEQTIEEHNKQMAAWVTFKNERERAAQYRNNMMQYALVIQAWWRGLLVRQNLGPYRVAKKKGAPKGKKK